MAMPYENSGRTNQKQRTKAALLEAARSLIGDGETPSIEQVADLAGISRTTAYRYFRSQRALLLEAIPDIERPAIVPADERGDVASRLDDVLRKQTQILNDYESQLRAALRISLDQAPNTTLNERPVLRQGRAIGWIEEALEPLAASNPEVDRRQLAIAIRATAGIESWVWLTDIAGLSRSEAAALMRKSAQALLAAAIRE